MRIAVSGASGFLGRATIARLAEAGHTVRALGRNPEAMKRWLPQGSDAARFDASEPVASGLLSGCDAVVNLAGEVISQRWTPEVKRRIRSSRIDGTRALAQAACASGTVKTFVSASAVGYYGPHGAEPLTEDAPPGDDFLAKVCVDWEAAAQPARDCGIRVAIVRIGLVMHPEGSVLAKMLPLFKRGLGGRLGSGEQVLSWVHRDDVTSLIAYLIEHTELSGPFNATSPQAVTNAELTRALAKALHRPALFPAPSFALKLALGEMSEAVLTGQRAIPARTEAAGFRFAHPSLQTALDAFFAR